MNKVLTILKYIGFYVIQWTWGILLNLMGLISVLFIMICCGEEPHWCGPYVYIYCPWCKNSAFEGGMFFVLGYGCESCAPHEMGHGLQNLIFGPLMPFVVSIPSMVRFWVRDYKKKKNPSIILPPYDSVWFEGTATSWGKKYFGRKWEEHLKARK